MTLKSTGESHRRLLSFVQRFTHGLHGPRHGADIAGAAGFHQNETQPLKEVLFSFEQFASQEKGRDQITGMAHGHSSLAARFPSSADSTRFCPLFARFSPESGPPPRRAGALIGCLLAEASSLHEPLAANAAL